MARESQRLAPEAIGVKSLPVDRLIPNPHNPRMLFDRIPMETLKESISKVGILVPLTVYWSPGDNSFVILDGQRRWICAQDLKLPEVPVNQVAEPDVVQNIVTMFQIHKLREDWELMPTALKIELLMDKLKERGDKKLAELTGLEQAQITRCKKLLSYPKKFQDLMLNADPDQRVKADFFIELYPIRTNPFMNSQSWFKRDHFTQRMLQKYQDGEGLKAVTDFRTMKQYITNAVREKRGGAISKRLREFTEDDSLPLDHLLIKEADVSATARKLVTRLEKLEEEIKALDVEEYYGVESLWDVLDKLLQTIKAKLRVANRRINV